jgi:hypothetical protein
MPFLIQPDSHIGEPDGIIRQRLSTRLISEEARSETVVDVVATALNKKAERARFAGMISFAITLIIGFSILALFLFTHGLDPAVFEASSRGTSAESSTVIRRDLLFDIINTSIVRVGSVLVAIFLIQILVGFSRYYYRIAEHLSACADMVRLSRGDALIIKELAPVLLPTFDSANCLIRLYNQ